MNLDELPSPDQLPAFDPDEFATAYNFAGNVVQGKASMSDPEDDEMCMISDDGRVTIIPPPDDPISLLLIALLERYRDSPLKYISAAYRILALTRIKNAPELRPWVRYREGGWELHPTLLDAAAVTPLTEDGTFLLEELVKNVRRFAREDENSEA